MILPKGPNKRLHWGEVSLRDQDVIVVQAKASRLGMYLMGQTLFSADLLEPFGPRSIHSVALCKRDDEVLRPLLEAHPGMEVVVVPRRVGR